MARDQTNPKGAESLQAVGKRAALVKSLPIRIGHLTGVRNSIISHWEEHGNKPRSA